MYVLRLIHVGLSERIQVCGQNMFPCLEPPSPSVCLGSSQVCMLQAINNWEVLMGKILSKAGELVSARRNRVKPKHVNTYFFLNKNTTL